MLPKDSKISKTVDLLLMLYHSNLILPDHHSSEEKARLKITKQIIFDAGLTIPQFISALRQLHTKGYTQHYIIFDDKVREQLNKQVKSADLQKSLKKLEESDTPEISEKIKEAAVNDYNKVTKHGQNLTKDDLRDEFFKMSDVFRDGIELFKNLQPHEIGYVYILPFRELGRLQYKMDDGQSFDTIQDTDIWYDNQNYRLYVGKNIFPTTHKGSPTRVHYILNSLFSEPYINEFVIDFSQVQHFDKNLDVAKENKKHFQSMHNFLKNNGKLRDILKNHTDRIEISQSYRDYIDQVTYHH